MKNKKTLMSTGLRDLPTSVPKVKQMQIYTKIDKIRFYWTCLRFLSRYAAELSCLVKMGRGRTVGKEFGPQTMQYSSALVTATGQ